MYFPSGVNSGCTSDAVFGVSFFAVPPPTGTDHTSLFVV